MHAERLNVTALQPPCKLLDKQDIAELGLVIGLDPGVWPAPEVEVMYVKAWFGMLIR